MDNLPRHRDAFDRTDFWIRDALEKVVGGAYREISPYQALSVKFLRAMRDLVALVVLSDGDKRLFVRRIPTGNQKQAIDDFARDLTVYVRENCGRVTPASRYFE